MGAVMERPQAEQQRPNSSLIVLPIKATAANVLAVTPPAIFPPQLLGRLTPEELHGVISAANETLKSHGSHSFLALLLPLLVVDLCSVGLIAALNPWLLLAPWDFPLADVALPISIEFVLFFCMFPVMLYVLHRRMSLTQARLRAQLAELSGAFAGRGVSFCLRQRFHSHARGSGSGANLWVEVALHPVLTALMPVAVPVPTLYPVLVDSAHLPPHARVAAAAGGAAGGGGGSGAGPSCAGGSSSSTAAGKVPMHPPAPCASGAGAGAAASAGAGGADGAQPAWDVVQAMGAQLGALHAEYVRLLQENQLLRAHLHQWQQSALQQQQQQQAAAGGQAPAPWWAQQQAAMPPAPTGAAPAPQPQSHAAGSAPEGLAPSAPHHLHQE